MRRLISALTLAGMAGGLLVQTAHAQSANPQTYKTNENWFEINIRGIDDVLQCSLNGEKVLIFSNGTGHARVYRRLKNGANIVSCSVIDQDAYPNGSASYDYDIKTAEGPAGSARKGVCYKTDCPKENPVFSEEFTLNLGQ